MTTGKPPHNPPMHIAHVAPEMAPFVKVGGLGDVLGSLPPAQARDGHELTVVLPGYARLLDSAGLRGRSGREVVVHYAGQAIRGEAVDFAHGGVRVIALLQESLFERPGIYGEEASYGDNGLRFGWFCAAAIAVLRECVPAPDAILCHDWPTGLLPGLLRAHPRPDDPLEGAATVMVVHNIAHQGMFPLELARGFGVPDAFLDADGLEALGAVNFLKGGINLATRVLTVSPTYAKEIVWPDYGEGLDQALLARGDDLSGILNGLDTVSWDPSTDAHLARTYTGTDLGGKAECKAALQRELGFREGAEYPVFGMVSRIDPQKGIDLVEMVAPWLVEQQAQVVVLGAGQRRLIEPLLGLARIWSQSVAVVERFDEALAHRIYAGSDFFLMPSRFEPCGLGQLVALRYGTPPIVRRTGGLADTVRDLDEHPQDGNGFVFNHADAGGLQWACDRALRLFRDDPAQFAAVRRRGMAEDLSWDRSARLYDAVLARAVDRERNRILS